MVGDLGGLFLRGRRVSVAPLGADDEAAYWAAVCAAQPRRDGAGGCGCGGWKILRPGPRCHRAGGGGPRAAKLSGPALASAGGAG